MPTGAILMPFRNKVKAEEWRLQWRMRNKDRLKAQRIRWELANMDKLKAYAEKKKSNRNDSRLKS